MIDWIAELGSPGLCLTTTVLFAAWLWAEGFPRIVVGFLLGIVLVGAATLALKWLVATPDSTLWSDDVLISQYFPSGHTALAAALYGSFAVALAWSGGGAWRMAPFLAVALSVAVAAVRVMTRLHPAGDALAGLTLGLIGPVVTSFALAGELRPLPGAVRIFAVFLVSLSIGWFLPAPIGALLPY